MILEVFSLLSLVLLHFPVSSFSSSSLSPCPEGNALSAFYRNSEHQNLHFIGIERCVMCILSEFGVSKLAFYRNRAVRNLHFIGIRSAKTCILSE